MTSDFRLNSVDDSSEWVIMSNGAAEYLVQCWLRVLESTNPGSPVVSFLRYRVEVGCPGMYGFDLDEGGLADVDARRLLAGAVERIAGECLAAIQGSPGDESLHFLTTHEPFYQARWLSLQERIHGVLRRSLDDAIPLLRLSLDAELRLAVDAMRHEDEVRLLAHAGTDLPRQLVLRREQCELQNRASKFFDANARKQAANLAHDRCGRLLLWACSARPRACPPQSWRRGSSATGRTRGRRYGPPEFGHGGEDGQ